MTRLIIFLQILPFAFATLDISCKFTFDNPLFWTDATCNAEDYCKRQPGKKSVFNPTTKQCVTPLGEQCWFNSSPCPEGAKCYGSCACSGDDHYASPDKLSCLLMKLHGEECNATTRCRWDGGSSCRDGVCACDSHLTWSKYGRKCISRHCARRGYGDNYVATKRVFLDQISKDCQVYLGDSVPLYWVRENEIKCPANSRLYYLAGEPVEEKDEYGHVHCKCDPTFKEDNDMKNCLKLKLHGEGCDDVENFCYEATGLTCITGRCECRGNGAFNPKNSMCYSDEICEDRFKSSSFYDSELNSCALNTFGRCEVEKEPVCAMNSICRPRQQVGSSQDLDMNCICIEDFTPSANRRKCVPAKKYGDECDAAETEVCSVSPFLLCLGRNCTCFGNQIWDDVLNRCVLRQGEECEDWAERGITCRKFSHCNTKTCDCDPGYSLNNQEDRLCVGQHLAKCDVTENCRPGFTCIDSTCKCRGPQSQAYDAVEHNCFRLVGFPCSRDTECTTHSECDKIEGVCTCRAGFQVTNGGKCEHVKIKFGESCNNGRPDQLCDFTKAEACVEGRCDCFDDALVRVGNGTWSCLAKLGRPCGRIEPVGTCKQGIFEASGTVACDFYNVECEETAFCRLYKNEGVGKCETR